MSEVEHQNAERQAQDRLSEPRAAPSAPPAAKPGLSPSLIAIVGGMMATSDAGRRGVLLPVIYNCGQIMKHWATMGRKGANRSFATVGALTIPYGIAIAAGALLWWFAGMQRL